MTLYVYKGKNLCMFLISKIKCKAHHQTLGSRWHDILEQITLVTGMVRFNCCSLVDKNLQYSVISCGGWWRTERRMRNGTYHSGKVHCIRFLLRKSLPFFLCGTQLGLRQADQVFRCLSWWVCFAFTRADFLCFSERFGLPALCPIPW